jgi:predicted DNA-binding protein
MGLHGGDVMPTKNPRINVVLEKSLYERVEYLAKQEGVSLSLKARDLIRESLETYEDLFLSEFAEQREATFSRSEAVTHDEIWSVSARK